MEKKTLWTGMLVIALVFGMLVIGCSNGSTNKNNDEPTIIVNNSTGSLTITFTGDDINGNYIFGADEEWDLFAASNVSSNGTITLGKIINNSVTLKVWETSGDEEIITFGNYNGNGSKTFNFFIFNSSTSTVRIRDFYEVFDIEDFDEFIEAYINLGGEGIETATFTFSSGSASGSLNLE